MGFWQKLFGRGKRAGGASSSDAPADGVTRQVWAASPQSRCGVCGKQLRGLSGGVICGSGADFLKTMLEGARYVCPQCGFASCFECCADTRVSKVICKRCKAEMRRG